MNENYEIYELYLEDDTESSKNAFRTYSNYLIAYHLTLHDNIQVKNSNPDLKNCKGIKKRKEKCTSDLNKKMAPYLKRGKLILEAMKNLPLDENPKLALTASFWAPVQAYYAAQGFGLACMIMLGQPAPESHTKFLNAMSHHIVKRNYLPFPFNISCSGHPDCEEIQTVEFDNLDLDYQAVKSVTSLTLSPEIYQHQLIAKALSTTRRKYINFKIKQESKINVKPGKKRRNLSLAEKRNIMMKLHDTTIFDFIFRLRIKSNYESPSMFLSFPDDESVPMNFYNSLLTVTDKLCSSMNCIIDSIMNN